MHPPYLNRQQRGQMSLVDSGAGSSSYPPGPIAPGNKIIPVSCSGSSHVPQPREDAECHNCRTLGLDCNAVHTDTKCHRCSSIGMECDLEAGSWNSRAGDGDRSASSGRGPRCGYCAIARAKCVGFEEGEGGACERCLRCGESQSCRVSQSVSRSAQGGYGNTKSRYSGKDLDFGMALLGAELGSQTGEDKATLTFGTPGQLDTSPRDGLAEHYQECGEDVAPSMETICCWWCGAKLQTSEGEVSRSESAASEAEEGRTLYTCARCFETKLDLDDAEIYCNRCKEILLRSVAREKTLEREEFVSWRPAQSFADPNVSLINQTPDSISSSNTSSDANHPLPRFYISNTATEQNIQDFKMQSGRSAKAEINNSDWSAEPYRPLTSNSTSSLPKWAFQPCIRCQIHSLPCDHSLPCCMKCKDSEKKCSYRYLSNPRRTKPIRSDEVTRICYGCFRPNFRVQVSGLCSQCEVYSKLENTPPFAFNNVSSSTTSISQFDESKSELPRFLATLNTRIEDTRLGHHTNHTLLKPHITLQANPDPDPTREPESKSQPQQPSLIPLPPIFSSQRSPLPGFAAPCFACLDHTIACALHPKKPPTAHLVSSIKPYKRISIPHFRCRSPPPHSNPESDPTAAIPCLACFDSETICAHHIPNEKDEIAKSCGSCRFASLECDFVKPNCGGCRERGVECLFIQGLVDKQDEELEKPWKAEEPETLPLPADTGIPLACGGCRISSLHCDETRPGCMVCKSKGLECMYISGGIPLSTFQGNNDIESQPQRLRYTIPLPNPGVHVPVSDVSMSRKTSCVADIQGSQLYDEATLEVGSAKGRYEGENEDEDGSNSGEEQSRELESESEDWDVVSRNEDVDTGRESDSDDGSVGVSVVL